MLPAVNLVKIGFESSVILTKSSDPKVLGKFCNKTVGIPTSLVESCGENSN